MWMILIAHGGWMTNNSFLKKNSEEKKKFTRVFFGGGRTYVHGKKMLIGVRNWWFGNM